MLEIETVAVLGADREAAGFALLCSLAGLHVRLGDERPAALDEAYRALRQDVEKALAAGLVGREERQRILDGILLTPELDEATLGADLVFATGPREPGSASALLARLAGRCRATALLATPLDPARVDGGLPQPGRVVGLRVQLDDDGPFPMVTLLAGPGTTPHAREQGERLLHDLARAAGEHR
jgi:3-hydroxyacyl-CoA dehydrogenase